uniref:Piezo-type mechanosensitive ion channel component n=1 Tax=Plectus sambesii TaxID=2011161 RepID=A0A914W9Z9_9BILA
MRASLAFVLALASFLFMVAALLRPCIFGVFYAAFSIICARGFWFASKRVVRIFVAIFCGFICCAQGIFFLLDLINGRLETIEKCDENRTASWQSTVGIHRLEYKWTPLEKFRGLGPDGLALLSSLICCYFARAVDRREPRREEASEKVEKRHIGRIIFHLFLLCMVSITDPTFINSPYFITFLIALIAISFAGRSVISFDRSVLIMRWESRYAACHLIAIYVFQLQATSNNITSMITNKLGIVNFFEAVCRGPHMPIIVADLPWTTYASVILLLALHVELCCSVRHGLKAIRRRQAKTQEGMELQTLVVEEEAGVDQPDFSADLNTFNLPPPEFMFIFHMKTFFQKIEEKDLWKTAAEHFYITVPFAIVSWAIMFPSIPSLIWMIMVLGTLPFAGTPRRRARILLPLAIVSIILLILQYCCSLIYIAEDSIIWLQMGFGTYVGETAFRMLFFKTLLAMFLFITRAVDRRLQEAKKRHTDQSTPLQPTPAESLPPSRRTSSARLSQASIPSMQLNEIVIHDRRDKTVDRQQTSVTNEMGAPVFAVFACSICVIGRYLVSIFTEQPSQRVDDRHWISMQSKTLLAAIWMPCTLLCFLVIVFLKRFSMTVRLKHVTISSARVRGLPLRSDNLTKTKICKEVAIRFLKRHFWKTVAFSMTFLAVNEISAAFLPLMIIVLLMVIFPAARSWCYLVATILLGIVWIIRFFIQFFMEKWPMDLMAWIGLLSMDDNLRIVLAISLICVQCRLNHGNQNPCQLFVNINFSTANENWWKYALFVFKYFFYKFGQEVSFIWSVCLAAYRQDVVGMIYLIAVFLTIFISRSTLRQKRATIWKIYGAILALIFLIEYALRLQLPPGVIEKYPWSGLREKTMSWFFLDSKLKKHTTNDVLLICGDLVQLMLVWSQESVFRNKPSEKGGDNILPNEKTEGISTFPSHCSDYASERSDLLSIMKKIVFFGSHWLTLIIILISIAFDDSFFALIYTFGAFAFLWQGTRLYAQNSLPKFLRSWMCLLYYNIAVLFFKFIYIGIGSFFMVTPPSWMWLKTLLGLGCTSNPIEPFDQVGAGEICTTVTDVIIFTLLVCQIRILNSWQFLRVVVDYRADRVLKSSGTKSINIMKTSEDRDNKKRVQGHLDRLKKQLIREDELCPNHELDDTHHSSLESIQHESDDTRDTPSENTHHPPSKYTHHQIKRSGSYHHVTKESMPRKLEAPSRATLFRKPQPWWLPSKWFFNESISHAYVAHRHEEEKRELKQTHLPALLQANSKETITKLAQDYRPPESGPGVFSSSMSTTSEAAALIGHKELEKACEYWENRDIIVRIIYSITTHTKMLCFVCLIATHVFRPAFITLPLPLFVFLWGALSVRPSKNFFITCIIYVGFIIQLRLVVQIIDRFCDLASDQEKAAKCPKTIKDALGIFGLLESENTFNKLWEILLLAVLLWHRYKVFRLGLWKQSRGHKDVITRIGKWICTVRNNKEPTSYDWYTLMVTCDFLFIFVLLIFYSFIGEGGSGDLLDDVRDSGVPRWLFPSLLFLVCMMIFDRFIYLSSRIMFPPIYYLMITIGLHIIFNIFIFNRRDYLNIPLLLEVRTAMDFWLTATSLSFGDWRRLENYHNEITVQNCWIRLDNFADKHFPTKWYRPTSKTSRWLCGCLLLCLFLLLLFSPLFGFTFLKYYGTRMPPEKVTLTVRLQGYPALYYMVAQHANLHHLNESERDELMEKFEAYPNARQRQTAIAFLNEYDESQDIYRVLFPADSLTEWLLSQPGLTQLLLDLNNTAADYKFKVEIKFKLYRSSDHDSAPHVWSNKTVLNVFERAALFAMIKNRSTANPVLLQFGVPPHMIAPSEGQLRDARPLTAPLNSTERNMAFELKLNSNSSRTSTHWQMMSEAQRSNYTLESPRVGNSSMIQLIIFVDKVFPVFARKLLELVGVGRIGMLGLMAFVLLVVGQKVFRPLFDNKISNAALENLPNADNILYLIRDIYLARENKDWYLEKRLFQKLVFLFRSPETLIAWSRYTIKEKKD